VFLLLVDDVLPPEDNITESNMQTQNILKIANLLW